MELPDQYQSLKDKRIFVTGAAGFIGGALFSRLAAYGLTVKGSVLFESEAQELRSQGFDVCVLDLTSDEPWDELLENIDVVFHVAAIFQEVEKSDEDYDKANHRAVVKLARAAVNNGVERFVHCSTVGVHGDVLEVPASEETPFNPMDVYHKTKLAGELALVEFGKTPDAKDMTITINRPAMVYGPGDMRMLKLFQAISSRKFVMIGSGKTLGHLGYIEDQVDSFLLCAVQPRENVHLEAFNIASGKPITLNELAAGIADAAGVRLWPFHIPVSVVWGAAWLCEMLWKPFGAKPPLFRRRVGFFTHNRAFSLEKSKKLLNYESEWSETEGLRQSVAWYRKQGLL